MSPATANENPFRTSRLLALPAHWDVSPETLLARWHNSGRRGALVGPHGTGKTTRMRALATRLEAEGWRIVWVQWHGDGTTTPADWRSTLRDADARTVVCLDGSENLGLWSIYRLFRSSRRIGGLLATLHRRSPFIPTLVRHTPDAAVFAAHAARLAPECGAAAHCAFAAARGNAHAAFRRLYLDYSRFNSRVIRDASASAGGFPS